MATSTIVSTSASIDSLVRKSTAHYSNNTTAFSTSLSSSLSASEGGKNNMNNSQQLLETIVIPRKRKRSTPGTNNSTITADDIVVPVGEACNLVDRVVSTSPHELGEGLAVRPVITVDILDLEVRQGDAMTTTPSSSPNAAGVPPQVACCSLSTSSSSSSEATLPETTMTSNNVTRRESPPQFQKEAQTKTTTNSAGVNQKKKYSHNNNNAMLYFLTVGSRVAVYWDGERRYFKGTVRRIRASGVRPYYIVYDDGDREWVDLEQEKWRVVDEDDDSDKDDENNNNESAPLGDDDEVEENPDEEDEASFDDDVAKDKNHDDRTKGKPSIQSNVGGKHSEEKSEMSRSAEAIGTSAMGGNPSYQGSIDKEDRISKECLLLKKKKIAKDKQKEIAADSDVDDDASVWNESIFIPNNDAAKDAVRALLKKKMLIASGMTAKMISKYDSRRIGTTTSNNKRLSVAGVASDVPKPAPEAEVESDVVDGRRKRTPKAPSVAKRVSKKSSKKENEKGCNLEEVDLRALLKKKMLMKSGMTSSMISKSAANRHTSRRSSLANSSYSSLNDEKFGQDGDGVSDDDDSDGGDSDIIRNILNEIKREAKEKREKKSSSLSSGVREMVLTKSRIGSGDDYYGTSGQEHIIGQHSLSDDTKNDAQDGPWEAMDETPIYRWGVESKANKHIQVGIEENLGTETTVNDKLQVPSFSSAREDLQYIPRNDSTDCSVENPQEDEWKVKKKEKKSKKLKSLAEDTGDADAEVEASFTGYITYSASVGDASGRGDEEAIRRKRKKMRKLLKRQKLTNSLAQVDVHSAIPPSTDSLGESENNSNVGKGSVGAEKINIFRANLKGDKLKRKKNKKLAFTQEQPNGAGCFHTSSEPPHLPLTDVAGVDGTGHEATILTWRRETDGADRPKKKKKRKLALLGASDDNETWIENMKNKLKKENVNEDSSGPDDSGIPKKTSNEIYTSDNLESVGYNNSSKKISISIPNVKPGEYNASAMGSPCTPTSQNANALGSVNASLSAAEYVESPSLPPKKRAMAFLAGSEKPKHENVPTTPTIERKDSWVAASVSPKSDSDTDTDDDEVHEWASKMFGIPAPSAVAHKTSPESQHALPISEAVKLGGRRRLSADALLHNDPLSPTRKKKVKKNKEKRLAPKYVGTDAQEDCIESRDAAPYNHPQSPTKKKKAKKKDKRLAHASVATDAPERHIQSTDAVLHGDHLSPARKKKEKKKEKRLAITPVSTDGPVRYIKPCSLVEEDERRRREESRPLTAEEISAILGEDCYEEGSSSTWVRRSMRQPNRSALEHFKVKELLEKLRTNDPDMAVLKLKKYIPDPCTPQLVIDAILDALGENTNCEALFIQNFNEGMQDAQVLQLLKVLQRPSCKIWCLNIGETYKVQTETWEEFTDGLADTKITHMYASEHTITSEIKEQMRSTIRENRSKHSMHNSPDNLDVIIKCTHCWWNPINAKCLRPYLKKKGYESYLHNPEIQGLKGSTLQIGLNE